MKMKPELSKKRARESVLQYSLTQRPVVTEGKVPSEEQLAAETLTLMKSDFSILLTAVRQSLERHKVSVESLLGHLRTLEAIGPTFEPVDVRHSQPLERVLACDFQSLGEVFIALAPYCSWFNHLIVRNIIETFCDGDKALERRWMKFQDKVREYCERRVFDCPEDQYGEGDDESEVRKSVVMKVDRNWSTIRVDQLFHIRDSVAKVLEIKPFHLYLRTVENGCIKMLFYIPDYAMSNVSHVPQEALKTEGVLDLRIINYPGVLDRHIINHPAVEVPPTGIRKRQLIMKGLFRFTVLSSHLVGMYDTIL